VAGRDLAAPDAVVVGAGPNGLAAALTLAREGFKVTVLEAADEPGGGTRSYPDPDVPGLIHDHCSAVHPFGIASPFLRSLPLERFGLTWGHPEIAVAHPFDDGTAAVIHRDLDATIAGLGEDGATWDRLYRGNTQRFDALAADLLRPILRIPRHPIATTLGGPPGLLPATVVARWFPTERGRALFGGIAAHTIAPLGQPLTAAIGLYMGAAGHAYGWPVAVGGSQSIWRAMVAMLEDLGGEVVTGVRVRSLAELPRARVALLDVTPTQLAWIAGDHLPKAGRRRAQRWTYGSGATKVDFAVRNGVPWTAEPARRAGTVHLAGTFEELAAAEEAVAGGSLPDRPFVLASQPHVADPSREVDGIVPLWAYAHVPHGTTEDAAPLIEAQIERFAPGFGDRVIARHVTHPADFEAWNPNLHGGDITGGASTPKQLLGRPRWSLDPYATGIPGLYLCSSSTPPGGGVHGLCGHHAARSALRVLTA
jgi:phytoene dehydrogenase-like protein